MISRACPLIITLMWVSGLCAGCSNKPGALTMKLKPTRAEFAPNDAMTFSVVLGTYDRPVCLSKGRDFRFQVQDTKSGEIVSSNLDNVDVFCGTGILESLIFFPYLYLGAWMDVADMAKRFEVLEAHEVRAQVVTVTRNDSGKSIGRVPIENNIPVDWPPGDYDVTIKLNNRRGFCGDFLPLPIGWQLYDQPVSATARVVVRDRLSAASQSAN